MVIFSIDTYVRLNKRWMPGGLYKIATTAILSPQNILKNYKDLKGNIINDIAINNLKEGEYIKEPSTAASDIYKKLVENNEESLVCLMKDRRNNPMKYLPILNKRHGWNLPGVSKERTSERALTASELPKLGEIKRIKGEKD